MYNNYMVYTCFNTLMVMLAQYMSIAVILYFTFAMHSACAKSSYPDNVYIKLIKLKSFTLTKHQRMPF